MHILPQNIYVNFLILIISFLILSKSADFLVDGAVGIAYRLKIPKMIIGIVLVGFVTTSPEFAVSIMSALRGHPEIALGNAIGSVITDDALALALGIIVAPAALQVDRRILKSAGIFLFCITIISFIMALNGTLGRIEGFILIGLLAGYLTAVVASEKKRKDAARMAEIDEEIEVHVHKPLKKQLIFFMLGVAGILLASEILVDSALNIANFFGVPEIIIGLTIIAIGTSLPEIATCVSAFRKGHGDLAFGDIIGADILNILWIIGAASIANPIVVDKKIMYFSFPFMIFVVTTMLLLARKNYRLDRWKGIVLLMLYGVYIASTIIFFYIPAGRA